MKTKQLVVCLGLFLIGVVSLFVVKRSDATNLQQGLPGVVAEIDAGRFASLQAALDHVPETGGIVRIPAGVFEISEPLVITTEDTRIEGAGTATHIKNINTDGKPTIMLRPDSRDDDARARIWRLQLGNFRISGTESCGDGILAEGVNEIFIHGVSIDHHGGHGIHMVDCYEDP